jgi:hypothetical protein
MEEILTAYYCQDLFQINMSWVLRFFYFYLTTGSICQNMPPGSRSDPHRKVVGQPVTTITTRYLFRR